MLAALLVLAVGCAAGPIEHNEPGASFVSAYVRDSTSAEVRPPLNVHWKSVAWRGEKIHKQLWVATNSRHDTIELSFTDLASNDATVSTNSIEVREIGYVRGDIRAGNCETDHDRDRRTDSVMLGDPLYRDIPAEIRANNRRLFWITIEVPRGIPSDQYTGELIVSYPQSGAKIGLSIHLDVLDIELPVPGKRRFHLDLWQHPVAVLDAHNRLVSGGQIQPWSSAHIELLKPQYRHLLSIGQKTLTTSIKDGALGMPSMITWNLARDGKSWSFDYSDFDRYVTAMTKLGFQGQISAFSMFGWNKSTVSFYDGKVGRIREIDLESSRDDFGLAWSAFLADFRRHLVAKGWFDRVVLYFDEPHKSEIDVAIPIIRNDSSEWRIGTAYSKEEHLANLDNFHDASGILEIATAMKPTRNHVRTFYTSCTQVSPNVYVADGTEPAEIAWLVWFAMANEFDGYLRWAYDRWPRELSKTAAPAGFTAGDASFTYAPPATSDDRYLSSTRLEILDDAIEEAEKILLLLDTSDSVITDSTRDRVQVLLDGFRGPLSHTDEELAEKMEAVSCRLNEILLDNSQMKH